MAPTSSGQLAMNLEPGVSSQLPITLSLKSVLGKNSLFELRKGNFVYNHWGCISIYFPTSDLFAQSILNRFHSIFFLTPITRPPPPSSLNEGFFWQNRHISTERICSSPSWPRGFGFSKHEINTSRKHCIIFFLAITELCAKLTNPILAKGFSLSISDCASES